MKAFFSFIMAIIMALFGLITPFFTGITGDPAQVPGLTVGEWLKSLVSSFNLDASPYRAEPYFESVPATDTYFKEVQISYERGLLTKTDMFKTSDTLEISFVAVTLVRAARLNLDLDAGLPFLDTFANSAAVPESA
ncbi:MAG: hypothetical protein LBB67_04840 [Oscillospiraceae bacterium]|jgi:hypothetical protein|nr:hypothetical protein [Oscillospiraceae bacterium]